DLVLVVVLQAVRVLAVAAVLGAAAGLHVGGLPRLGAERAQEGGGVAGARADFHVVGLQQGAALLVPVVLQAKNDLLEGQHGGFGGAARAGDWAARKGLARVRLVVCTAGDASPG